MAAQMHLIQNSEYPPALINLETEAGLLGALMVNNSLVDQVSERVSVEDFSEPLHRSIYATILSEVAAGRSASPPTLRNHFINDPDIEEAGGVGYLGQLTSFPGVQIGVWDFVRTVSDLAKRRRLLDQMKALQADVTVLTDNPVESLVDKIDNALSAALQRTQTTTSLTIAQAWDRTMQAIEDEAAGKGPQGIRIKGLDDFNQLTGGLRRGELLYLGGRTSMGKTAVALKITTGAADAGNGTLFVSLEMRVNELTERVISDVIFEYGNSPTCEAISSGKLNAFDRERVAAARAKIDTWPLIITDPSSLSIGRLAMMIRRYQRQMAARGQALDLVVIDYLGLIKGSGRSTKRYEEVGEISRTLKQVAKECDVALIVLAQLNRETERREDKRPQLSDLRDAGDIEQDADHVMFVYREQYYLERSEPDPSDKKRAEWELGMAAARDKVELLSAKVRRGRVGRRVCHFFADHQAVRGSSFFKDMDR
jgi:replicative DNA helicase